MSKNNKLGYYPNLGERLLIHISKLIGKFFSFNNFFINQVVQSINLTSYIKFNDQKIFFKTGHNRLNWRVKSFYEEEPLMIEWLNTFNENDIFLDIGANVGTYSLPAISKSKFVYACELDPKNNSILFENILLNNFQDKCLILNFGLNENNSIEEIYYRDNSVGDALQSIARKQVIPTLENNPFKMKQILFSLDFIFENFKLIKPNKIKIDVDGNEMRVFKGGEKTILSADEIYYEDNGLDEDNFIIKKILVNNFKIHKEKSANRNVNDNLIRNIIFKKIN